MSEAQLFLIGAAVVSLILALLVSALAHQKKSTGNVNVIGAFGVSETSLNPEGAVIVNGELWRAFERRGKRRQPD